MVQTKPINPIPTTVRIPYEIKDEIDRAAKHYQRPIHQIIIMILRTWYNDQVKVKK